MMIYYKWWILVMDSKEKKKNPVKDTSIRQRKKQVRALNNSNYYMHTHKTGPWKEVWMLFVVLVQC